MTSYFGRKVLRVYNIEKDLAEILQNEINHFLPLENVSTCNNEVDIYTPSQMQHRVLSKILEVLNANTSLGKIYTIKNVEVKSTIVIVTNIPIEGHVGYMDEIMANFGRPLTKFQHVKVDKKSLRYGWVVYEDLRCAEKCISFINENIHGCFMNAMLLPEDFEETSLFNLKTIQIEGFPKDFTKKKIRKFLRDISPDRRNVPLKSVTIKNVETTYQRIPHVVCINFDTPGKAIEIFSLLDNCVFPYNHLQLLKFKAYFVLPNQSDFVDKKINVEERLLYKIPDHSLKPTQQFSQPLQPAQLQPTQIQPSQRFSQPLQPAQLQPTQIQPTQRFSQPLLPTQLQPTQIYPTQKFSQLLQPPIYDLQHNSNLAIPHQQQLFHTLPFVIRPGLSYTLLPTFSCQNTVLNSNHNRLYENHVHKFQDLNFQQYPLQSYPIQHQSLSVRPMYQSNLQENVSISLPNCLVQNHFVDLQNFKHSFHSLQHTTPFFAKPERMYFQNELFHLPQDNYSKLQKFDDLCPLREQNQSSQKQNDTVQHKNVQHNVEQSKEGDQFNQNIENSISTYSQNYSKKFDSENTQNAHVDSQDVKNTKNNLFNRELYISLDESIGLSNQRQISWEKGKKNSKRWSKRSKIDKKHKDLNSPDRSPQSSIDAKSPQSSIDAISPQSSIDAKSPQSSIDAKSPQSSIDAKCPQSSIDAKIQSVKIKQKFIKIDKFEIHIKVGEKVKIFNENHNQANQSSSNSIIDVVDVKNVIDDEKVTDDENIIDVENVTFESDNAVENNIVVEKDILIKNSIKNDDIKKPAKLCECNAVDNVIQISNNPESCTSRQNTINNENTVNKEIRQNKKFGKIIVSDTKSKLSKHIQMKESMLIKDDILSSLLKMSILDSNIENNVSIHKSHPLDIKLDDNIKNSRLLSFMKGICYQRFSPNKMINRLF